MSSLRICGPSLGFLLGSAALAFYEDPFCIDNFEINLDCNDFFQDDPHLSNKDPRWVGAWWMGFLLLGVLILIFTLPMFMFPRQFKGASVIHTTIEDEKK